MRKPVGPGTPSQPQPSPHMVAVEIDQSVIRSLRGPAAKRETTVPALIQELLGVVAEEPNLVRAILDD
jgi:hypothetical protein